MAAVERPGPMEVEAGASPLVQAPRTTQYLTRELLSWATNALEAVAKTEEARNDRRAMDAILDAMKKLDRLYTPILHHEAEMAVLRQLEEVGARA
jgi:hypothetical protein